LLDVIETGGTGTQSRKDWCDRVHRHVKEVEDKEWRADVSSHSSLALYAVLKERPSVERYLSCNSTREGRLLKLQARSGTLPLLTRLSSIARSPAHAACRLCAGIEQWGTGLHCAGTELETLHHFFLFCPFIQPLREGLYARVLSKDVLSSHSPARFWFERASDDERLQWLLGGDMHQWGSEHAEANGLEFSDSDRRLYRALTRRSVRDLINRHVQHYLMLAWRLRERLNGGRIGVVRTDVSGWSVDVHHHQSLLSLKSPTPSSGPTAAPSASEQLSALYSNIQVYAEVPLCSTPVVSRYVIAVEPQCAAGRNARYRRRL
jgi:hypothetical protein